MKKLFVLTVALFISQYDIFSNDSPEWKLFKLSDNCFLPKNITSIVIDRNDTKWIGTDSGLVMIDRNCNCESFNIGHISSMVLDKYSNLWMIIQPNDIVIKRDTDGNFHNFKLNEPSKSAAICADSLGNVWIGIGQLGSGNEKKNKMWKSHDESIDTLDYENSYLVKWLAIAGYDPGAVCLESDNNLNNLWIGTQWGGFFRVNLDNYRDFTFYRMYGFQQAFRFAVDKFNNVWMILGGGGGSDQPLLGYLNVSNGTRYDYKDTTIFRHSNEQNKICIESERKIWLGLIEEKSQKYSLVAFDAYNSIFTPFDSVCPYPFSRVNDIEIDYHNNKWIATDSGLIVYREGGVIACNIDKVEIGIHTAKFSLDIYPNPSDNYVEVKYEIENSSIVTISIVNNLGVIINKLIDNQFIEAGNHSIEFDASSIPPGVNYISIKSGNYIETKKMLFIR